MTEVTVGRLLKASQKATKDQLQHLLVILTPEGQIQLSGCENFVDCIHENDELFKHIKTVVKFPKSKLSTILCFPSLHLLLHGKDQQGSVVS